MSNSKSIERGLLFITGDDCFEGDYAAGQRQEPRPLVMGDFATGQRTISSGMIISDFAEGMRTLPRSAERGSFATGQTNMLSR